MPEPTATTGLSITAFAIALLGPLAGPYCAILFAALAGSLWPLSSSDGLTRSSGAWLMLRCVMTSIVLTATVSAVLSEKYGIQPTELLSPVSFLISAMGNGWRPVLEAVSRLVAAVTSKLGGNTP